MEVRANVVRRVHGWTFAITVEMRIVNTKGFLVLGHNDLTTTQVCHGYCSDTKRRVQEGKKEESKRFASKCRSLTKWVRLQEHNMLAFAWSLTSSACYY